MALIVWSVIRWVFNSIILKFVVMGAIYIIVSELSPLILDQLGSSLSTTGLSSSFSSIPAGVWFFLDFFALDVGLPLLLTAYVSRFLIRRIPLIG